MMNNQQYSYRHKIWKQFFSHRLGAAALGVVILFFLVGVYAPFLASNKPLFVSYDGTWFFPLFRYLFYTGFYTKRIDIFFNLMMFSAPAFFLVCILLKTGSSIRKGLLGVILFLQLAFFLFFSYATPKDPAFNSELTEERQTALREHPLLSWDFDLKYMTPYAKLNLILLYRNTLAQNNRLAKYFQDKGSATAMLWQLEKSRRQHRLETYQKIVDSFDRGEISNKEMYNKAMAGLKYINEREKWLQEQNNKIQIDIMPLIRHFHWEDDAGGDQEMNLLLPWWELTRTNRKDLVSALIFGVRISLIVGIMAVSLAMIIGIPIGAAAGYYAGKLDILVSRLLEIWESMPTFFMLLLVVAMTQSKSIFIVIAVVGIFGWTGFSRYIRGEFFKQRNLAYVEACHALGFRDSYIMFRHILPNAIPPVLTLLPFAIMGAITSEAGLSFLGLGEEGSCSWGVLMDEGRTAFPGESYLLWPPAILLTLLLVAIALVGDALRDALDPKMHR